MLEGIFSLVIVLFGIGVVTAIVVVGVALLMDRNPY